MTAQTISIHRALTLIKKAEKIVADKLQNGLFVSTVVGVSDRPSDASFTTVEQLAAKIQSDTDTVESNLKLISDLKLKIQQKNLETLVLFQDSMVSVTELLAIKSTLAFRTRYAAVLKQQVSKANVVISKAADAVQNQLAVLADASDKESVWAGMQAVYGCRMVTSGPSVQERIETLESQNAFLENEIDTALSEVNITTLITL